MNATPHTLPGRYYTDPAIFNRELDLIFATDWIRAGRAEDIPAPGDFFLREVAGESLIITRDGKGVIHAFYNVCRHRGTRMCSTGSGTFAARIQCPYHGWTYGLDGRLLGASHMDDIEFHREDYPLHAVETALWDGHIFLRLHAGNGMPLAQHLGALPARFERWRMQDLRRHTRIAYDVRANWKLIVLNYSECLHCPLLHPALNRLTNYLGAENEEPAPTYIGGTMGFRSGAETMSLDGTRSGRSCLPGLSQAESKLVAYYAIYPNLLLSLHPDYMMVHSLWPLAVDRTEVVCEWYFHPDEMSKPGFDASGAVAFWDTTNREDWNISELSQAGNRSRACTPGPYSPRESLLHAFDQYVLRRLEPATESSAADPVHCHSRKEPRL